MTIVILLLVIYHISDLPKVYAAQPRSGVQRSIPSPSTIKEFLSNGLGRKHFMAFGEKNTIASEANHGDSRIEAGL